MLALLLLWVGLSAGATPNCGKTLLTSLPEGDPQVLFVLLIGSECFLEEECSNINYCASTSVAECAMGIDE